jgi:hypothetical protein
MSRNFEMRTPRFPPGTCDLVFPRHRDVSPPGAHLFSTKCSKTPVPSRAMLSRDCRFRRLHDNSGARFCLFTKLPTEIRRFVWDFALTTHIRILWENKVSVSKIKPIMQSCREARD